MIRNEKTNGKLAIATVIGAIGIAAVLLMATLPVITQMAYASVAAPVSYMSGVTGSGTSVNANTAKFTVSTSGTIPKTPDGFISSNIAVGYAWADVSTGKALVAAIHPTFKDSTQNPHLWHTHTVTLTGGATTPNDFCVVSVDSSPTAGIAITGSSMTVNIAQSDLPTGETPSSLSAVVGFSLQSDTGCTSTLAVLIYT